MAAHDDATVTIDTNEMTYTRANGITSKVANAETFKLDLTNATPEVFECIDDTAKNTLLLEDGRTIRIDIDKRFTSFRQTSDATAAKESGSIWFIEDSGMRHEWKVSSITMDSVSQPTLISSATLTSMINPMWTMTLTNITVSQP